MSPDFQTWFGNLAVVLLFVSLVGAQLWAVVKGRELWPFGANTMFAHSVSLKAPLCEVAFVATVSNGEELRIDSWKYLGILDAIFMRLFFVKYYGASPRFPQGSTKSDHAAAFSQRLLVFATMVLRLLNARGIHAVRLRVEVQMLVGDNVTAKHMICDTGLS